MFVHPAASNASSVPWHRTRQSQKMRPVTAMFFQIQFLQAVASELRCPLQLRTRRLGRLEKQCLHGRWCQAVHKQSQHWWETRPARLSRPEHANCCDYSGAHACSMTWLRRAQACAAVSGNYSPMSLMHSSFYWALGNVNLHGLCACKCGPQSSTCRQAFKRGGGHVCRVFARGQR